MATPDGGPAFPRPTYEDDGDVGMSLRDYFAGQALSGYVHMTPVLWTTDTTPDIAGHVAAQCYAVADAMLKAREA